MSLAKDPIIRHEWDVSTQLHEPSSVRDQIVDLEAVLLGRVRKLYTAHKISFSEFDSNTNDCQTILDLAARVNSLRFNQVLTDMQQPAEKIIDAINSLEAAADKIQGFQKMFDILSRLIKLVGALLNAITRGSVAAIGTFVTELENIANSL